MFEIQTNIPPPEEAELPAELTPVQERRMWLQNAFQKQENHSHHHKKEKILQSPTPRQGLVQDRVEWLKQQGEKYSKTVLPDTVCHPNPRRDTRMRWSEGEALHYHRSRQMALELGEDIAGNIETRNDVDENLELRNSVPVAQERHSFPLAKTHGTPRGQPELQIRDEPHNFLFPVVNNNQEGEIEMTGEGNRLHSGDEGIFSPTGPSSAQRIIHPASTESVKTPQAHPQKQRTEDSGDALRGEQSHLSENRSEREYDRVCMLSPASANSLPDYAHLNAGAMAKAKVEGIVSEDDGIAHHRRRHLQSWRKHKAGDTPYEATTAGIGYISFQTPMGKEDPKLLSKKNQLEAEVVETQCLEHCIIL